RNEIRLGAVVVLGQLEVFPSQPESQGELAIYFPAILYVSRIVRMPVILLAQGRDGDVAGPAHVIDAVGDRGRSRRDDELRDAGVGCVEVRHRRVLAAVHEPAVWKLRAEDADLDALILRAHS